jgi:Sigma-70 region 2
MEQQPTSPTALNGLDETLGSAVQSGFNRARSWRVPPNWSAVDWFEEMTAVGTAAAWQAVCDFDPARGVALAGFGYCRMMAGCLSRYRKEWRYALHVVANDRFENETTSSKQSDLAISEAVVNIGVVEGIVGCFQLVSPESSRLCRE